MSFSPENVPLRNRSHRESPSARISGLKSDTWEFSSTRVLDRNYSHRFPEERYDAMQALLLEIRALHEKMMAKPFGKRPGCKVQERQRIYCPPFTVSGIKPIMLFTTAGDIFQTVQNSPFLYKEIEITRED